MERYISSAILSVIMLGGFGSTIWIMRRWLIRVEESVGMIEAKREACREELPGRFAAKDSLDKLWERTDDFEKRLSYAEGIRNGGT